MDSHKNPGGGSSSASSKPSGTVPITVRFNAGDECIDDLFQSFHNNASGVGAGASDSLSSSPSQPQATGDEINARSFLQTNFFNRKSAMPIKQHLSPTHLCAHGDASNSPTSAVPGEYNNGSQMMVKYRRSVSFPGKGGSSPTSSSNYTLDINITQATVQNIGMGNGNNNSGIGISSAGATGGGDAPYLGNAFSPERLVSNNGMDMRPIDHCLSDIIRNMGGACAPADGVTSSGALSDRMRAPKLNEHHLSEADAVVIASGNGGSNFLEANVKMHSPAHSSPHSQTSENMARYSRKVFVGGLPPDIDEDEITSSFRRFGPLVVDWPHKAESKSYFPPKGYAFLLFQDENSVQQLIDSCITDDDKLYLCVSSPTIKDKPVQIRPWRLADADYVLDATMSLDPRKTVFVGGVPRPLKAFELAMIMDRLYGGVCYAGIDTDPELKYPKGAGRVAFSNQHSYIAAISARFVQLQHGDIDKRVEVKPYVLDDQMCDECEGQRCGGKFAPFFCANVTCLQYYCEHCWAVIHSRPGREYHKPLVKEGADRPRAVPFRWC